MSTTALVKADTDSAEDYLTADRVLSAGHDRCDRCGAEAYVIATKAMPPNGDPDGTPKRFELLFCGHHGKEKTPVLVGRGFTIHDQTHRINEKPSPSANHEDD